jgi:hypothetical protein
MSKFANRRSPSGPQSGLQLPFYNTSPTTTVATFATIGESGSSGTEPDAQYSIPVRGRLDTLQISNQPVGVAAVGVTYQARKNGAPVGPALVILNNSVVPVKVDLSSIAVDEGDLISIEVNSTAAVFAAPDPTARVLMTWVPGGSL